MSQCFGDGHRTPRCGYSCRFNVISLLEFEGYHLVMISLLRSPERLFAMMFGALGSEGERAGLHPIQWTSGEDIEGFPEIHGCVMEASGADSRTQILASWGRFLGLSMTAPETSDDIDEGDEAYRHPTWSSQGDDYFSVTLHIGRCHSCDEIPGRKRSVMDRLANT